MAITFKSCSTPCPMQAKLKAVEEKVAMLEAQFAEATAKKEQLARQVRPGVRVLKSVDV
jgi:hypothetical protein